MGENADTVKARWDDFGRGDIDGAVSTTDENAEIVMPETLPWGGTYRGPDGFKEMIQKFVSNFESIDPKPTAFWKPTTARRSSSRSRAWARPSPEMSSAGDPSGFTRSRTAS